MSKISLGRYVYGLAAIISGVLTFAWRDLNAWREIMPLDKVPHPQIFLYIAAAIELLGGLAILWGRHTANRRHLSGRHLSHLCFALGAGHH